MKILVISHNPLSSAGNMGKTMTTLLKCFSREELCQFYVYPSCPDGDFCSSYYRLTDKEVLKGMLLGKPKGSEVKPYNANSADKPDEKNAKPVKRSAFKLILRDIVWKLALRRDTAIEEWAKSQNPDCIFLAPGYSGFIYDLAFKISKKLRLPVVAYICDDYYFIKSGGSLFKAIQRHTVRKKTNALMKKTSYVITVGDEIRKTYQKVFGAKFETVMTGSAFSPSEAEKYISADFTDKNKIVYLGNLSRNRYLSLVAVGEALEKINEKSGTNYGLVVYSFEKDEKILKTLQSSKAIEYRGAVGGDDYLKAICSAEVLLHTEAFDKTSIELVKLSVSTKIADILASGRKILAFGPENVASIKYLKENDAAYVVTEKSELESALISAFGESGEDKIRNAKILAENNHDSDINGLKVRALFEGCLKK